MTAKRTRILANWCYFREDVTRHLLQLDKQVEWIFLYRYEKDPKDKDCNFRIIYWNDFASPYDILEEIKPDKVLFHDIESFHQVALNIASKNSSVPTLVLEHGMRSALEIEVAFKKFREPKGNDTPTAAPVSSGNNTASFFFRSLRLQNFFSLPALLLFVLNRKKHPLTIGLYKSQFRLREADSYINFTLHNASYILKRDGVAESKIITIGNPAFDAYFQYFNANPAKERSGYYLLIDAPYCEQEYFTLSQEQKISFYERLNAYCLKRNRRLVVKLHPLSYNSTYLPVHPNIEYIKETNIAQLVQEAEGCFTINFSTLSPLVFLHSPVVYFNTGVNLFDAELSEMKLLPEYDFHSFKDEQVLFTTIPEASKKLLVNKYLYQTDGRSTERLCRVLTDTGVQSQ